MKHISFSISFILTSKSFTWISFSLLWISRWLASSFWFFSESSNLVEYSIPHSAARKATITTAPPSRTSTGGYERFKLSRPRCCNFCACPKVFGSCCKNLLSPTLRLTRFRKYPTGSGKHFKWFLDTSKCVRRVKLLISFGSFFMLFSCRYNSCKVRFLKNEVIL